LAIKLLSVCACVHECVHVCGIKTSVGLM